MADPTSRTGVRYTSKELLDYLNRLHASHDEALQRAFDAPEKEGMPAIQVGPSEGRLIGLLLRLAGARKVIEVGTLAGYSAIWIGRALMDGGQLWSIEADPKHAGVARRNIQAAGLEGAVTVLEGKGLHVLRELESKGPFDAVFVDADKASYAAYGRWAAANVRKGGLLLADNAFFFGRLLEDGEEAACVRRMHEEARDAFESVCIGTGDGLLLGIKK